ncbi:putative histone-binding protein rbbD [Syncephalastrum racemosum]|uniref:Putative histone-binding protein rbbD n=1 Tax=Syncephalastrum racemosum TaxID=13706 RepID=A0A1X2HCQ7_SYNRA|nr:putative histone-binding protein rbbD [Syncephalastrum racemosum]
MSGTEQDQPIDEAQQIQQDYAAWKKNVPELYEHMLERALTWPSLTVQWLPTTQSLDANYTGQELLIGSHTDGNDPNYLEFLMLENPPAAQPGQHFPYKWRTVQRIKHEGEANRARYQWAHPNIIATKAQSGDVNVFDRHGSEDPFLKLKGHTREGYGLEWSPHASIQNQLLSGAFDNLVCHWDIGNGATGTLEPLQRYQGHTDAVGDVSWHESNDAVFASVADDKMLFLWDTRAPSKPTQRIQAHREGINSVAFNKEQTWMLATGSADKTIGLFDIRKLQNKLHSFEMHEKEVLQVAWNPKHPSVLASSGADRQILIWNLKNIGEEQTPEDMEDGPPELMFMHCGHTSQISDLAWNPSHDWQMASAAEDNVLQVWEMNKALSDRTPPPINDTDLE